MYLNKNSQERKGLVSIQLFPECQYYLPVIVRSVRIRILKDISKDGLQSTSYSRGSIQ